MSLSLKANAAGTQGEILLNGVPALQIDSLTSRIKALAPYMMENTRQTLSANRTYYVRTDGNDSNTGLVNDSAGAFLTIQKAIDVVCSTLDIAAGVVVTIQVADGTYTTPVAMKPYLGAGTIVLQGNISTPANCVINTTSASCVTNTYAGSPLTVKGFKLIAGTSGNGLAAYDGAKITFSDINFGTFTGSFASHLYADRGGLVMAAGNYTISGSVFAHAWTNFHGGIFISSRTLTLLSAPAFSGAFLYSRNGWFQADGSVYSGSATGKRYDLSLNAVAFVNGGTLPGSVAGTVATGGQYT